MNKKAGIGAAVVVILILCSILLARGQQGGNSTSSETTTGILAEENGENTQDGSAPEDTTGILAENGEGSTSDSANASAGGNGTGNAAASAEETTKEAEEKTSSEETKITGIELPYKIEDTGLVVKKIGSYDGAFVEDGSDKKVKNVLTMTIENTSDQVVQYSNLTFLTSNGKKAEFKITMIPAGGEVIAFEQNKMKYKKSTEYQLDDQMTAYMDPSDVTLLEDQVSIVGTGKNKLTVSNITDGDIKVLRIFYKYQYEDGTYVGGITFTSKIKNLKANDSITITPDHYDVDGCTVIMAQEYDE